MYMTQFFLLRKFQTGFSRFSIFILSGEHSRLLCSSFSFLDYLKSTSGMYSVTIFIINSNFTDVSFAIIFTIILYEFYSPNSNLSFLHLKPFTGYFCDIFHPCRLFTLQYIRYDHCLCHNLSCTYWHINELRQKSLMPFSTISSISQSVNKSSSTSVFFRHA